MTDIKHTPENNIASNDAMSDEALASSLNAAYEQMGPTSAQKERMLAALTEAQREANGHAADASSASPNATLEQAKPAPNRTHGGRAWKIALPLAACLVAGAVVIGVAGQSSSAPSAQTDSPRTAESAAVSAAAPETKNESAPEEALVSETEYAAEDALATGAPTSGLTVMSAQNAPDDGEPVPYPDFNTEEYSAVEEHGFVSTKTSPLSTVSADVDTASYCNVRRMINDGYALGDLPSGSVRIEEMLNYFDYDYPTLTCGTGGDLFSMQAQSATCPWNEDTKLLVLGFAAAPESTSVAEKGSNLVFLVDVSGSMSSPDKLDLLQDSFATLLESLGPNDRVSIVTYANGEDIVLEGASGDDDKEILRAIYKLHAEGSTNGEAGLKQAYEVAERNYIEGGVNRIIMASDGDLNVGITSESDLYDFVDGKRESGIYLSVLGFGSGNYKDNKMETLADHGNGSYHYIDCIDEAERVLKEKLAANLTPFADDVKVQVEFNPSQVKGYRLIGYENRALADEDFRNDEVDAGDVGPGSQFTVAYEVVLVDSKMEVPESELKYSQSETSAKASGTSSDWLTCTMRYHVFDGDKMHEQELPVGAASEMAQPSDDWRFAAAVIEFGMLARNSKYAGTSSSDAILDLLGTNLDDERDGFKRLVIKAS